MQKRRLYLLLIGIGLVGALLAIIFRSREREPEYGGKSLSEWVEDCCGDDQSKKDRAHVEIGHIGTNAIPFLLSWITYDPAVWKIELYENSPRLLRAVFVTWRRRDKLSWASVDAFGDLGPKARMAIPDLARLMNDPKSEFLSERAARALAGCGLEALPALVVGLTNQPTRVRGRIVECIGSMGTNARPAYSALTNLLNNCDSFTRSFAIEALRKIDPEVLERATR